MNLNYVYKYDILSIKSLCFFNKNGHCISKYIVKVVANPTGNSKVLIYLNEQALTHRSKPIIISA